MSESKQPSNWLGAYCNYIHDLVVGRDAETAQIGPDGGAISVLPTWVYLDTPLDDAEETFEYLTPIRLIWDHPQVIVHNTDVTCHWHTDSIGVQMEGDMVVTVGKGTPMPDVLEAVPTVQASPHLTHSEASDAVAALTQAGACAQWSALALIEPFAMMELRQVERVVSAEVHDIDPASTTIIPRLMDDTALEGLRDELVLEPGRNTGTSAAQRLVDNSTLPGTFISVEPGGYLKRNIRRDAETIVRRHIQDPHAGVRIRRIARTTGITDPNQLLQACMERYPNLRLSTDAIGRALDVGPDTTARSRTLREDWGEQLQGGRKLP